MLSPSILGLTSVIRTCSNDTAVNIYTSIVAYLYPIDSYSMYISSSFKTLSYNLPFLSYYLKQWNQSTEQAFASKSITYLISYLSYSHEYLGGSREWSQELLAQ
jgi:hypothetical protein